jgi:hypothetical protein
MKSLSKNIAETNNYSIALDDQGNKISPPVMASQLSCRPTLERTKFFWTIVVTSAKFYRNLTQFQTFV